jgi:hypothetical protein
VLSPRDKFYGPLKAVAKQYIPLLMARMQVLQDRANQCMEYLDVDYEDPEVLEDVPPDERVAAVARAQSTLHKSVVEAAMCQSLVGSFADLLENDYQKIKESQCFFLNEDGELESLYDDGDSPDQIGN